VAGNTLAIISKRIKRNNQEAHQANPKTPFIHLDLLSKVGIKKTNRNFTKQPCFSNF
jgi:hypothetical protein